MFLHVPLFLSFLVLGPKTAVPQDLPPEQRRSLSEDLGTFAAQHQLRCELHCPEAITASARTRGEWRRRPLKNGWDENLVKLGKTW